MNKKGPPPGEQEKKRTTAKVLTSSQLRYTVIFFHFGYFIFTSGSSHGRHQSWAVIPPTAISHNVLFRRLDYQLIGKGARVRVGGTPDSRWRRKSSLPFSAKFCLALRLLCKTPAIAKRQKKKTFVVTSAIYNSLCHHNHNHNLFVVFVCLQIVSDHVDKMISGEDFERTIQNFDSNFSLHLMDLLEKLSHYSTIDCEHQMLNIIARLDHNGYYTAQLEKKAAEGD